MTVIWACIQGLIQEIAQSSEKKLEALVENILNKTLITIEQLPNELLIDLRWNLCTLDKVLKIL